MSGSPTVTIDAVRAGTRPVHLRLPFRFGDTEVRDAEEVFVEVALRVDGREQSGHAAQLMVPRWFDKRASRTNEDTVEELRESMRAAGRLAAGRSGTVAQLAADVRARTVAELEPDMPELAAGFGPAVLEASVIDAACRAAGLDFPSAARADLFGLGDALPPDLSLEAFRGTLKTLDTVRRIAIRHTVGHDAPLTADEVVDRPDALPVALDEVIRATGIDRFKLKLGGDVEHDLARLADIARVIEPLEDYRVTLDANEQYADVNAFAELVARLKASRPLARLSASLLFFEQPYPREIALADDGPQPPSGARLLIDESDDSPDAFARALERGWVGTSVKSCKGVLRALVNAARVRQARERGIEAMLSGEDLTCQPGLAWQQDTLMAATVGIDHVERNGHHFAGGMQGADDAERRAFLDAHPDLYREVRGRPTLAIERGRIGLDSLFVPGFASLAIPDLSHTLFLLETSG